MNNGHKIVDLRDVISQDYLKQNVALHRGKKGFGGSGWKHADAVYEYAAKIGANSILDYGCGEGSLKPALQERRFPGIINEWDPAVDGKWQMPRPADLTVCTDVFEHVEPEFINRSFYHLHSLTIKGCYLVIATRPANKLLPDGTNAHKIIEDTPWWLNKFEETRIMLELNWQLLKFEDRRTKGGQGPHEVRLWLKK